MTRKTKIIVAALAAMVVIGAVAGFFAARYWIDNRTPNFTEKYVLYVHPETTVEQVLDSVYVGAGTIRPKSLERAFQ